MKKIKYIFILIVITGLINGCKEKQSAEKSLKGKVKKEVIYVAPKVPGRILTIHVKESDIVKKGDTLAVIDIPEVEAKYEQATGALVAARSQYEMSLKGATKYEREQVEAMLSAAEEQFSLAEKTLERLNELYRDSLIPAQEYDEIFTKYMQAKAQLTAADAKKKDVETGVRTEKILMAKGNMLRAKGAVKEAEAALQEKYITAPVDMSIETIALQEGELALPGYNIFVGYLPNSTYFRFTVPESEVLDYKAGQNYSVKMAYKEKSYQAKVTGIKQLASYADRTTPFPEYEIGESLYELKLIPERKEDVKDLVANITVLIIK